MFAPAVPFMPTTPRYLYSSDRKAEHARNLLEPCRGFLHAYGYAGFANLYEPDPKTGATKLVEVACWAHARGHLYDVHVETSSPVAREALDLIARLFAIEADILGGSPMDRREARQSDTLPRGDARQDQQQEFPLSQLAAPVELA